ncbi:unnamed protein product, partial [Discosporangium mesarthrocarpum]
MPSIAAFIQSLLAEDMYATGLLEKMDERIHELNNGQLKLLLNYCESKTSGLTNKTVADAYEKLLKKATLERDRRHEEELREEQEKLRELKAAHAGVNAKAWDTSHAGLDCELAKFQRFLKSKARRKAAEEVTAEEIRRLHHQLLALPARRVAADRRRLNWSLAGAVLMLTSPGLAFLPVAFAVAVAVAAAACCGGLVAVGVGQARGHVPMPRLDEGRIARETLSRARGILRGYRAEVRKNYEEFELAFDRDMRWRAAWLAEQKRERRAQQPPKAKKGGKMARRVASDSSPPPPSPPPGEATEHLLATTTATSTDFERTGAGEVQQGLGLGPVMNPGNEVCCLEEGKILSEGQKQGTLSMTEPGGVGDRVEDGGGQEGRGAGEGVHLSSRTTGGGPKEPGTETGGDFSNCAPGVDRAHKVSTATLPSADLSRPDGRDGHGRTSLCHGLHRDLGMGHSTTRGG